MSPKTWAADSLNFPKSQGSRWNDLTILLSAYVHSIGRFSQGIFFFIKQNHVFSRAKHWIPCLQFKLESLQSIFLRWGLQRSLLASAPIYHLYHSNKWGCDLCCVVLHKEIVFQNPSLGTLVTWMASHGKAEKQAGAQRTKGMQEITGTTTCTYLKLSFLHTAPFQLNTC